MCDDYRLFIDLFSCCFPLATVFEGEDGVRAGADPAEADTRVFQGHPVDSS